ncbi:hypothetical protein C8Q75DRAFT_806402 [Abortiporus biennis]|nr:hypothetical protein C8Q75DRAFT_806402 [Abortiporus biennis]
MPWKYKKRLSLAAIAISLHSTFLTTIITTTPQQQVQSEVYLRRLFIMENSLVSAIGAGSQTNGPHDPSRRRMAPLPRRTKAYYLPIMKLRQHLLLPFELLMAICRHLDADCLRQFALVSRMFADASLSSRFYSVTIRNQLRAEELFAMQNFSTHIAPLIQHVRLSLKRCFLHQSLTIQEQEQVYERAQEFLIWAFKDVLNKFNNLTSLSFTYFTLNDTTFASTPMSKLNVLASLPLHGKVRHVRLKHCEFSSTSYNLLFAYLTQIRSLVIDDCGLFTGDPHPLISFPELAEFTMKQTGRLQSLQLSKYIGEYYFTHWRSFHQKLKEVASVEELEIESFTPHEDSQWFLYSIPLQTLPNLRVLKLGALLGNLLVCPLFDTITSPNLQRVEGRCDYMRCSEKSLLSTMEGVDEAMFKVLKRSPECLAKNFRLILEVTRWHIPAEVVLARLRSSFSKLPDECVIINVMLPRRTNNL